MNGEYWIQWLIVYLIPIVLGILLMVFTYVLAPRASEKSGHFVSGTPIVGGMLIALGFLLSPYKWLALLGFIDPLIMFVLSLYRARASDSEEEDDI